MKDIILDKESLTQWRHELHAIPEMAFQEQKTAQYVEQKLKSFGVKVYPRMAGTGVIASLSCGKSQRSIALRADLEALPIVEQSNKDYCSIHQGVMHACGHDGHTTMLLGAAQYLSEHLNFDGIVYFIFQPAEENEGGGRRLVEEGLFEQYSIDAVYGMHNWPGLDAGQFSIRSGAVMAAYDVFDIIIHGKGGHAAAPHHTIDPIVISAALISALQTITSRQVNPLDAIVLSITRMYAGDSYNVIPQAAHLSGTLRSLSHQVQDKAIEQLKQIVNASCAAYGATAEIKYQKRYPCTVNTEAETQYAYQAALDIVGEDNIICNNPPSMGSEDFSFLLNESKGC